MTEYLVKHNYAAKNSDELTLKKGQIIRNVEKTEDSWWLGDIDGVKGVFPSNFVEELKEHDKRPPVVHRRPHRHDVSPRTSKLDEGQGHDPVEATGKQEPSDIRNMLSTQLKHGPPHLMKKESTETSTSTAMSVPAAAKPKTHRVKTPYQAQSDAEIDIEAGDVLEVRSEANESNFVEVVIGHRQGWVPLSHLEELHTEEEEACPSPKPKGVTGVGFGDIFSGQTITLKKPNISKPVNRPPDRPESPSAQAAPHEVQNGSPTPPLTSPVHAPKPQKPPPPAPRHREKYKATHRYKAEQTDEISLEPGDEVTLQSKETGDQGWWLGEVHGKVGLFPKNFVTSVQSAAHAAEERRPKKKPPPPDGKKHKKDIKPPHHPPNDLVVDSDEGVDVKPHFDHDSGSTSPRKSALSSAPPIPPSPLRPTSPPSQPPTTKPPISLPQKEPEKHQSHMPLIASEDVSHQVASAVPTDHATASARDSPDHVAELEPKPRKAFQEDKEKPEKTPLRPEHKPAPPSDQAIPEHLLNDISFLKTEVQRLRENSVSRAELFAVQEEVKTCRDKLQQLKVEVKDKLTDTMNEIDALKKTVATSAVDIQRVRSLAQQSGWWQD